MADPNAGKFITSLVKSLQMVCHGYMEFNDSIEIIGHINLRIDNRQKFDYIVNEQVCKQGGESTFFQSNSYHSLPPGKYNGGERERQHSGKFDDDGNVNNHHRLDEPVAAMGGPLVHVDLSGPVPVTRSTSAPSHDGFFSTAGSNRRRSLSRDSRLLSVDEEQSAATLSQDHSFNHSSLTTSKNREPQMDREEMELAGNGGAGGERNDPSAVLTMYRDADTPRQQGSGQRQDVIVKPEPSDHLDTTVDESGGVTRVSDALDASSASSGLPAAHQSTVLATAAHSGHTMLAATTLGHPSFFDASLAQQDAGEASRHTLVQQAIMQQIINAQKHAQHLALPGLDAKPLPVLMAKGPMDCFLPPGFKHLQIQSGKSWNHQPSSLLLSRLKTEGDQSKTEEAKSKSESSPVPSTSGSGITELDPKIKNALANKLARRGRGRGSRKFDPVTMSSRRIRRQFRCSYCDYASVRRYNTERHIRLRHPTYRYKCPLEHCSQILLDEEELRIHVQGHSGTAFFLQCQDCGIMCGDYDSLVNHQNSCAAVQRDGAAVATDASDRVSVCEDRNIHQGEPVQDSCGFQDESHPRGNEKDNTIKHGNEDICGEVDVQGNSEMIPDHPEHNVKSDEDDSVEVVEDDNLPVHFMVKEEMADSSPSS